MNSIVTGWYTVYTLPKFEKKINAELGKRNIEAYVPLQKVFRKWSDRIKLMEVPLFPNYVFIKAAAAERLRTVDVRGICNFVSFDGRPACISDDDILTIRRLESQTLEVESKLVSGDPVRIIRGPLAGLRGVLFSKKGKERVGVRIETIKETLSLEVPCAYLETA